MKKYFILCDYHIINPCVFKLWEVGLDKIGTKPIYMIDREEFYFDSHKQGYQMTDEEYYQELKKIAQDYNIEAVLIDPWAASFIEKCKEHGDFKVVIKFPEGDREQIKTLLENNFVN